jgi:hypothetical protein
MSLALAFASWGGQPVQAAGIAATKMPLNDQRVSQVLKKKVFFGHQSVGSNVIQGIKDVISEDSRLELTITRSSDPHSVPGTALVEFPVGQNGKPQLKNEDFTAIIDKGMGAQGGVAMFKYCYVDINSRTDVQRLFEGYRRDINRLKLRYPRLTIVHVTVPLTTGALAVKATIKALLGKPTERDANVKRNEFNVLLRQAYGETDPFYDLAEVESTHADGSRSFFMHGNEKIYVLAPELASDNGHLNENGRRKAAERLLHLLADL